jgi:hypothetical protein
VCELDISVNHFKVRARGAVGCHHGFKLFVGGAIAAPVPDDENARSHWKSQWVNMLRPSTASLDKARGRSFIVSPPFFSEKERLRV